MPTICLRGRITDEAELDRALEIVPLTGAEIVEGGFTGGWTDWGISDGEEWVRQRRSSEGMSGVNAE